MLDLRVTLTPAFAPFRVLKFEIDFLNQKYQLDLPESEDYETLNGLILFKHQSIPLVDEKIAIEGFNFLILEVNKTRIEKVQLLRLI